MMFNWSTLVWLQSTPPHQLHCQGAVREIGKFEAIIIFSIPKLTIRDQLAHFVDNPFKPSCRRNRSFSWAITIMSLLGAANMSVMCKMRIFSKNNLNYHDGYLCCVGSTQCRYWVHSIYNMTSQFALKRI